jgi:hypothetical protein
MRSVRRFRMAASFLLSLILLELCPLACMAAAAQSPEQEMEAEAHRLLPTFFTKWTYRREAAITRHNL